MAANAAVDVAPGIFTPVIQYGFAGFSAILLAIVAFGGKKMLDVLQSVTQVMTRLGMLIEQVLAKDVEDRDQRQYVRDKLASMRCIADKEPS